MIQANDAALAFGLLLCGCGSAAGPGPETGNPECRVQLAPRTSSPTRSAALPSPEAPESRVVVQAEAPLAPLQETLEQRVPQQLAEGRTRIGPGGTVSYRVERGALSLRVTPTSLLIETPARAQAKACRGDDCYASCEPEARIVAEVPLMLRPDYRFQKSSVSARFTRGCKVRALGGFLTVDVTPTIEGALRPELDKVARDIDAQLPAVASQIRQAWGELTKSRELPLGGCFVLQPFGVIQGPFVPSTTTLSARFAVQAHPELRSQCGDTVAFASLPPLQSDPALPGEGVVQLAMVTPIASVASAFQAQGFRTEVASRGRNVDVNLLSGHGVCGDLGFEASLSFRDDSRGIRLTGVELWPGERERLGKNTSIDVGLMASGVHIDPLLSVQGFKDAAPALAKNVVQPGLEVSASVSSTRAAGATARGDSLVAWLEARGAIRLKASGVIER